MRKLLILILAVCMAVSTPVEAKSKSKYKVIGHQYVWATTKVRVKTKKYLGKFCITYYCPCAECCGSGGGHTTASGTTPKAGRTVAVDPSLISYGTKLKIGKKDGYIAEDTGGGVASKHIDIFVNSHSEALRLGTTYKKVWAIKYKWKKKRIKVKVPIYEKR